MGKATLTSLWRQSVEKNTLPIWMTNTDLHVSRVFFFMKDHVRSLRHHFCVSDRTLHRAILWRDPARDWTIFIYRSNSSGRWKDSRLLVAGEDTFVVGIFAADSERRRYGPLRMGEAKKTLRLVIMACGVGYELTWNIKEGETLRRCVITLRKGYPFFRWTFRAYQGYEDTIYLYYYVLKQFRHFCQKNPTLFRKSKLTNRNPSFRVTKANRQYTEVF